MDGLVLVDKPPGKTSHDLTLATRRLLGVRKAGHAGTLDPFATGLLLVLVGRARRVQRFLMALPKQYVTVARLGALSTTGDPEGEITHTGRIPPVDVALPTGRIVQRPPIYSAVRVQGRKAYERARDGEQFEVPEREVDRLPLRAAAGARTTAPSSSSSARPGPTCARSSPSWATATARSCGARASGRSTWRTPIPQRVLPLEQALAFLPRVEIDADAAWRAGHGQSIAAAEAEGEHVLLADADGPVAIAEPREDGLLKPVVGFRG